MHRFILVEREIGTLQGIPHLLYVYFVCVHEFFEVKCTACLALFPYTYISSSLSLGRPCHDCNLAAWHRLALFLAAASDVAVTVTASNHSIFLGVSFGTELRNDSRKRERDWSAHMYVNYGYAINLICQLCVFSYFAVAKIFDDVLELMSTHFSSFMRWAKGRSKPRRVTRRAN